MVPVPEHDAPTAAQVRDEIVPLARPAVLRGVCRDWPLVAAARDGDEAWLAMLAARASDERVSILRAGPEIEGRFHYSDDGRGLNFARGEASLRVLLGALRDQATRARPEAWAAQGLNADRVVPGFSASHPFPHVPVEAEPRLWIGNAAKVATHNDRNDNIAVVVAGRRRFTLFPPEQVANLYLGPLHFTPAGVPVSMAHVTAPDFERYPRFAEALEAALVAELGPGDAIFIPYGWYHHVEALDRFNLLANYWWNPASSAGGAPRDAMIHGLMAIAGLPDDQRAAWRAAFEYYVFRTGADPAAHLDPGVAGVLGPATPETIRAMRRALIDALMQDEARAAATD